MGIDFSKLWPWELTPAAWWKAVVAKSWVWQTGLIALVLFSIVIIGGRFVPVHVRVLDPEVMITHVQQIYVVHPELDPIIQEAVVWTSDRGCDFRIVSDINKADILVDYSEFIDCGGQEALGCTSIIGDQKTITLSRLNVEVAEHELLHAHNLQHPIMAPSGHILHPQASGIGSDDRGVLEACARTRAY